MTMTRSKISKTSAGCNVNLAATGRKRTREINERVQGKMIALLVAISHITQAARWWIYERLMV